MGTPLGERSAPTATASTGTTEPTGRASGYTDRRTIKPGSAIPSPLTQSRLGFPLFLRQSKRLLGVGGVRHLFLGVLTLAVGMAAPIAKAADISATTYVHAG